LWKLWLWKLTFDPELSSRGIQRLIHPKENGETIQKRRSRVLPKGKFRKFCEFIFGWPENFKLFKNLKKENASAGPVNLKWSLPKQYQYQTDTRLVFTTRKENGFRGWNQFQVRICSRLPSVMTKGIFQRIKSGFWSNSVSWLEIFDPIEYRVLRFWSTSVSKDAYFDTLLAKKSVFIHLSKLISGPKVYQNMHLWKLKWIKVVKLDTRLDQKFQIKTQNWIKKFTAFYRIGYYYTDSYLYRS